jgi:4-amino-4-deoxy-L-arabinose transferase-like glycosyltransferase
MSYRFCLRDFIFAWAAVVLVGLIFRPITPIDETRAVSVAWEMWQRHDFLVPHLNGEPYSHKPPLLQWCIQIMWLIFGVSEWSARMVAPLFGLGNLFLATALARRLWPRDELVEKMVPWLLLAMPIWALWTSLTLYDMMVTFFAQLGMLGVLKAGQGERRGGWLLTGFAIGGGVVAKGPVILLLILPTALFAPWWFEARPDDGWWPWYRGMLGAIGLGAVLGLAWAVPAGISGGAEYRRMIFWGQSAGRIANAFAHKRPFWWYLELLPLLLFPWFWWSPVWKSLRGGLICLGQRFCLVQVLFVLGVFSMISGKQIHYLLPMYPALALLIARALSQKPGPVGRWDQLPIGIVVLLPGLAALALPHIPDFSNHVILEAAEEESMLVKWIVVLVGLILLLWRWTSVEVAVRSMSIMLLFVLVVAHIGSERFDRQFYDLQPFADRLAATERAGAPIAHWRKYNGEYQFLGRLQKPVQEIDDGPRLDRWLQENPGGYVIVESKGESIETESGVEYAQPYRGSRRVQLWRAAVLRDLLAKQPDRLDRS